MKYKTPPVTEHCDTTEHDVEYGQGMWHSKRDIMSGPWNWNAYIVVFGYRQIICFLRAAFTLSIHGEWSFLHWMTREMIIQVRNLDQSFVG